MHQLAVTFQPGFKARADFVAEQLGVQVFENFSPDNPVARLVLNIDQHGLALFHRENPKSRVCVDFLAGANNHRRNFGGGKNQLIGKAVGLSKGFKPNLLDMTAGLGRDAFVMATLGATVTLCEQDPVVYWLLQDGIERALNNSEADNLLPEIMRRMHLVQGSSLDFLQKQSDFKPDVIYLDPMFPDRTKTARVKKEMALLQELLGEEDADALLEPALAAATYRVVVKRPQHAPYLENRKPGYSLSGKSVRFDIYPNRKIP